MKIYRKDFPKKVKPIRNTNVYSVHDLVFLKNLNVSMTVLHPDKATSGHSHEKEEEVYVFFEGSGEMQLGEEKFGVEEGDIVLIQAGKFHKVFNTQKKDLVFLCVFQKYKGRGK
ncbi:MAG: cupin domain-containing protein [Candidatus Aenigmarchaeota archaeon]|nr:cupin domain-containing protein [Candidatus Aenigmarchaeota archaeon]